MVDSDGVIYKTEPKDEREEFDEEDAEIKLKQEEKKERRTGED